MLISIIGQDAAGKFLLNQWQAQHLPTDGILQKAQASTPMVSVIFTQGSAACSLLSQCNFMLGAFDYPQLWPEGVLILPTWVHLSST